MNEAELTECYASLQSDCLGLCTRLDLVEKLLHAHIVKIQSQVDPMQVPPPDPNNTNKPNDA